MGTNMQISSPVCFDRNNLMSVGAGFVPENGEYLPRPSSNHLTSNHLTLSDSGIHLDLFHEDDDLSDLNGFSFIKTKDRVDIPPTSPSYNVVGDEMIQNELSSSSSQGLEKLGFSEKGMETSTVSSDCSVKGGTVHRSKGRPAKLASSDVTSSSSSRSIIQCLVCSKNFNNSSALAKHKLIHSEERKYACSVCSKAFKRQDHLNGHMMTHSSKKPYECKYVNCDKSYCDQRSLRRHIENHHQHFLDITPPTSGRMPVNAGDSVFRFDGNFLSIVSGRGIESTCGLLSSPASSVGMSPSSAPSSQKAAWPFGYNPLDEPKPVKCTVCDRRFKNLPALNGHMRLHGGFVKKDLAPEVEKRNEDLALETSKTDSDDSKDLKSRSLRTDEWASSTTNEDNPASELFHVKQEDTTDDVMESVSDYSDFLRSSVGELDKAEQEYKSNCFVDLQLLKSEMLPAMEDLQLKDTAEQQFSIGQVQQLCVDPLSDKSNFLQHKKTSVGPQHSSYRANKFGIADDHFSCFSSQSGSSKPIGSTGNCGTGNDQQVVTSLSKHRMLESSGNVVPGRNNLSAVGSAGHLCGSSSAVGGMLRRNFAGGKMRKTITRPLTPGCAIQHGYGSTSPNARCSTSAQCTPLSPFAGRAVYPTDRNQSQLSRNSTIFEFPPTSVLDSSRAGSSGTPIRASYALAQQHTPHTPLSPYTPQPNAPYTPKNTASSSRLSRFQFPPSSSGQKESGACESPYQLHQKSAYHPYNHHHSSLPSPRYTQLHHQQLQQQQQLKSDNFENDVMQMNKEIEQHLQQLVEEDNKKNMFQLDQSFHIQQHGHDLYDQQEPLCETKQKLQLGDHCLLSDQAGIQKTLICSRDQNVNPRISFGKYPNQQRAFLDEKLALDRSEFDMELELDSLNMLNLSSTGNLLDKKSRFGETSIDQAIGDLSQLDAIDMLILGEQFGDVSSEMTLDEISNVDIINGHSDVPQTAHNDSFDMNILNSKSMESSGAIVDDHFVHHSISKWMNHENLPRYDAVSSSKDGIFLNPNQLDGFKKKKRRPDPIIIPSCVNNFQTVASPRYSPNTVGCMRKNILPPSHPPPSHPPPPYTALPVNAPATANRGSFQMPYDVRTPQSAPTFHFVEDGFMPGHNDGLIRREKPMFSWDQNAVDSSIENEIHQFPASSCYSLISNGLNADNRVVQHLSLRSDSSQDELGQFVTTGGTELDEQEHRIWKIDELNGYRQNLLENGNIL